MEVSRPRRRKKRWIGVLALFALLGLGVAGAVPILAGKTTPPKLIRAAAEQAVTRAREEDAERWAPELHAEAEAALRRGQLEQRLEEVRFLPFRDFTAARTDLETAEQKANLAREGASQAREDAKTRAELALGEATEALDNTEAFAHAMHLNTYERTKLQHSKVMLSEAQILFGHGEFSQAEELAVGARTQAAAIGDRAATEASRYSDPALVRRWRESVEETVAWSRKTGEAAIVVFKEMHRLVLYRSGKPARTYEAEMGYNSVRDKRHAGDAATPEGRYKITAKKGLGESTYHRALLLNYPNEEDRRRFERERKAGQLPQSARVGGLIEIHGEGGRGKDWTKGCVALYNKDMDDLFSRVQVGTPVTIVGGDGSGGIYTDLIDARRGALERRPQ